MKHIVVFGAGKSSTVLIDFLKNLTLEKNWKATIADANYEIVRQKTSDCPSLFPVEINLENAEQRKSLIHTADIVISLMPPHLHLLVAKDCIEFSKNLLTASYIDDATKALANDAKQKGILFLYEMGLDPGIDHMSAMQIINKIQNNGGKITSFISHCGGLVAPESDDNPWNYKISWNPRNVVLAGKAGAQYLHNNSVVNLSYQELFNEIRIVAIRENEEYLSYYPNRDSLSYIDTYSLKNVDTFIRTTLRYPMFCNGWKVIVDVQLTNEEKVYDTTDMSIAEFYQAHFAKNNWLKDEVLLDNFIKERAIKLNIAEADKIVEQFIYLGLNDNDTLINLGIASAADVLQFLLEKKLKLNDSDKDIIVMLHEFEYILNDKKHYLGSLLKVIGDNNTHTAMAKTVGLPLGIAAQLILEDKISETGLHIPIASNIYEPVMKELKKYNIEFDEKEIVVYN